MDLILCWTLKLIGDTVINSRAILSYRRSPLARYQECMASAPKESRFANDDNPWIIPNFLFIAANFGLRFATSRFLDLPTSSPMFSSLSTLCLSFIIFIVIGVKINKLHRVNTKKDTSNPIWSFSPEEAEDQGCVRENAATQIAAHTDTMEK